KLVKGIVDDPTPLNPCGQTAADLASINGNKGIDRYLAEADLASHLSTLSRKLENGSRSREEEQESLTATAVRSLHLYRMGKVQKSSNYEDYLHVSSSRIQQDYLFTNSTQVKLPKE
ncbi:hypothetical protein Tco_0300828, partial [Tanacetum coccineum]